MKPQVKRYLLLFVAILVASAALYAQASVQEKPKQEKAVLMQAAESKADPMMMDCCIDMAKGEVGMKDMMKMCHSMMSKKEKAAEHAAGCSMMGMDKHKSTEKVN